MTDPSKLSVEEVRRLLDLTEDKILDDGHTSKSGWESTIAALCRHYLANPMTAGEFAGLVIRKAKLSGLTVTAFAVSKLAAEHNIEIVEPKK